MVGKSQSSIEIDCEKVSNVLNLFSIPFLHCPMDRMVGKSQSSIKVDCEKVSNVEICFSSELASFSMLPFNYTTTKTHLVLILADPFIYSLLTVVG